MTYIAWAPWAYTRAPGQYTEGPSAGSAIDRVDIHT